MRRVSRSWRWWSIHQRSLLGLLYPLLDRLQRDASTRSVPSSKAGSLRRYLPPTFPGEYSVLLHRKQKPSREIECLLSLMFEIVAHSTGKVRCEVLVSPSQNSARCPW